MFYISQTWRKYKNINHFTHLSPLESISISQVIPYESDMIVSWPQKKQNIFTLALNFMVSGFYKYQGE